MTAVLLSRNSSFSEFKLRGHRGSGGFSDVYEAVGDNGKRVALKVLRVPGGSVASNMERFERELRILQRIDNRRVARLVAAKLDADPPWIASEFIDGPNLREAVNEKGHFGIHDASQLLSLVAKVLSDLHSAGIAHRDLTPNNILLGDFGPVIVDFGSAKDDLTAEAGSVLSVGTPNFAAPEVLSGGKSGISSDIYSLAKIFLFLLGVENDFLLAINRLSITEDQKQMINRCLVDDPGSRPKAVELANLFEFDQITSTLTNEGYSPTVLSKLPRRVSLVTSVLCSLFVAVSAVVITFVLVASKPEPLTPQTLIDRLDEKSPTVALEVVNFNGGWLKQIPSMVGFPASYKRPVDTFLESSPETVEAFISFDEETANIIQTTVDVISVEMAEEVKEATSEKNGHKDLASMPLLEDKFKIKLTEYIDKTLPSNCKLLQSEKVQVLAESVVTHVRLLAGAKDCLHQSGNSFLGLVLFDVFPNENAMVITQVSIHGETVSIKDLVAKIKPSEESLIRSVGNLSQEVFSADALKDNGLAINDQSRYQKVVYSLPAGGTLKIQANTECETKLSGIAIPVLSDASLNAYVQRYISLGGIEKFSASEAFLFENPTANDWIIVFEFDERGNQGFDFSISLREGLVIRSTIKMLSDFRSEGIPVEVSVPNSVIDFPFVLPRRVGEQPFDSRDVKFVEISSVMLPVRSNWFLESVPKTNTVLMTANPSSPFLDFFESDAARLDIQLDAASWVFTKKETYPWYFMDLYQFCHGIQEFTLDTNGVVFAWKVFNGCLIDDAMSTGDKKKRRFQVTPIVKFVLVFEQDEDGDGVVDYWNGAIRGEFVPETVADLDYWDFFVKTIALQVTSATS